MSILFNHILNRLNIKCFWLKLVCALCFSQFTTSQNKDFKTIDSLKNKSYQELCDGFLNSTNDTLKSRIYAFAYLKKAKKDKDTLKIAKSYSNLASCFSLSDQKKSLKYADSIIILTKKMNHFQYPGHGYLIKGMCLNNLGLYSKSLENYFEAIKLAEKNKNITQLFYCKNQIGQIKSIWGDNSEAISIFKSQLIYLNKNKQSFKDYNILELNTVFHLSNCFFLEKKFDSALYYTKIGIEKSTNEKNNYAIEYFNFLAQSGEIKFFQNKFNEAIDSLQKAFPFEYSSNGFLNNHYFQGKSFDKLKNEKMAFYHFEKADSIYELTQDVVPEVRGIQEYFVNYYKTKGDLKNQLKYIDRLLLVDSTLNSTRKKLMEKIHKEYDTPKLISEKSQIINKLKSRERKSSFIIYILIGILSISLFFIVRYYKLQKTYKIKFQKLVQNQDKVEKDEQTSSTIDLSGISKDIIESIISNLKEFERSNSFTDNSITLSSLSQTFNTNSTYLSKVINAHKKKNFSTYISDLRIDYAIEKLKTDSTFRKFGVKSIAHEIGFNNVESFSKAFYKNNGIYPSYFIKELEND